MKIILTLALLFALVSSQNLPWEGLWTVWDVILDKSIGRCCVPSSIKITKETNNPNQLNFFMELPPQNPECPSGSDKITFSETVEFGSFNDTNPASGFKGMHGKFFPNNNTIVIHPGPLGNCKWVLGSSISIKTNDTETIRKLPWEGPWVVDSTFKPRADSKCCLPLTPKIVKIDQKRLELIMLEYFPVQEDCPEELNGKTIFIKTNIAGGSFISEDLKRETYYLQNNTVLSWSYGCVIWWKKWEKPSFIEEIMF